MKAHSGIAERGFPSGKKKSLSKPNSRVESDREVHNNPLPRNAGLYFSKVSDRITDQRTSCRTSLLSFSTLRFRW